MLIELRTPLNCQIEVRNVAGRRLEQCSLQKIVFASNSQEKNRWVIARLLQMATTTMKLNKRLLWQTPMRLTPPLQDDIIGEPCIMHVLVTGRGSAA